MVVVLTARRARARRRLHPFRVQEQQQQPLVKGIRKHSTITITTIILLPARQSLAKESSDGIRKSMTQKERGGITTSIVTGSLTGIVTDTTETVPTSITTNIITNIGIATEILEFMSSTK